MHGKLLILFKKLWKHTSALSTTTVKH